MEQRFEGNPRAEIRLDGRQLIRSDVTHDWGSRLQWEIRRNGEVIATPPARASMSCARRDDAPGDYEVVLQLWKYINYRKRPDGEFTESRFVVISNKVTYTV